MSNSLREHQLAAFKALQDVDRIFRENGVRYFILAGTTLGAVRHGGFIPWDDDIDIGIFPEDKARVSQLLENELSSDFKWADRRVVKNFPRIYGKVLHKGRGCVDVFVLAKTSNRPIGRRFHWILRKLLTKLYKVKIGYENIGNIGENQHKFSVLVALVLVKIIPMKAINLLERQVETRYSKLANNEYYLNVYSPYSLERELIQSKWLTEPTMLQFEDGMFPAPNDPHSYLTHLYGDYMTPPPESERQAIHVELFEEDT